MINFGNPYIHPGSATMIVSREGIGKSTIVREWAAALTRGESWPSGEPIDQPIPVSWCGEEAEDYWRYRMEQAGADLSMCRYTDIAHVADYDDGPQIVYGRLMNAVPGHPGRLTGAPVGLVVIDPLLAAMGDIDERSYSKMRRAVSCWMPRSNKMQYMTDAGCHGIIPRRHPQFGLVLIHHANREQRRDQVSTYYGSVGLGGVVDTILDLVAPADPTDTRRDLLVGKSRDDRRTRRGDRLPLTYFAGLYMLRDDPAPIVASKPATGRKSKAKPRPTDETDYGLLAEQGRSEGLSLNAMMAAHKITKNTVRHRKLRDAWRALPVAVAVGAESPPVGPQRGGGAVAVGGDTTCPPAPPPPLPHPHG